LGLLPEGDSTMQTPGKSDPISRVFGEGVKRRICERCA
jgi:hypothetical protein